jgi:N utilization substance protein B
MAHAPRSASAARHRARCLLVQALYQWQVGGDDPDYIRLQFVDGRDTGRADVDYFRELMRAIPRDIERLDAAIAPLLQRSLAMVDPVERAILRLACHELLERPEVPVRVVINEAVELARRYGASEGHRFINGIVDRLAHDIRAHEFKDHESR